MTRVLLLKLLRLLAILLLLSLGAFFLLELVPGDPVASILGDGATPAQFDAVRRELGLDRPAGERYLEWLRGVVTGDFGRSLLPPVQEVSDILASRLPVTLEITVLAMLLSFAFAVPMALWSAHRAGRAEDAVVSAGTSAAVSMPSFLTALLLIYVVIFQTRLLTSVLAVLGGLLAVGLLVWGVRAARREQRAALLGYAVAGAAVVAAGTVALAVAFPEFPRQGFTRLGSGEGLWANLRSAFLPALTLALLEGAVFTRILRNDLIGTLNEDFILSARAKGLPTWAVLTRHALRPSSLSLVTVAGVSFGRLLGGTVIVETIFRLPGMGSLLVEAIQEKDYPVVQAGILLIAVVYVLMNALVDVSYTVLDPRLRRART